MKTNVTKPDVAALGAVIDAIDKLDGQQRLWVLQTAASRFAVKIETLIGTASPPGGAVAAPTPTPVQNQGTGEASLKAFMKSKNPQKDVQRVTCLAYFLTKVRDTPRFKTKELNDLNTEASWPKLSNPTVAVNNARKEKYLTPVGKGDKQLTNRGEDLVEALPDQEKVKSLLSKSPARKKRARKKKGA